MKTKEKQLVYLPLENLENEISALTIERSLSKINGLAEYRVELNNKRAAIHSQDSTVIKEAIKAINDLGFNVVTIKKKIPVLEMFCASCAISAESMAQSVDGVIGASVNYATKELSVEYLPNMTDTSKLQKAIQSIGYDLLLEEDAEENTLEIIQERHYQKLKRNTIWAILLSLPVMIIGMFFMDMPYANLIMWMLSTPVLVWFGKDFFINAWKQAQHRSTNMDTLVALSTGIAYIFSVFNMLYPSFWESRGLEAHVYFEAAAVIIAFILLGRLLEEKAKGNTSTAIKKLMGLQPKTLTIIDENNLEKEIKIEDIELDHIIVVKPGDKIAVDGVVTQGNSYVDESMLSGEPIPVLKEKGEEVFAGTINQKGSFRFKATKVGKDTMLANIIQMIQEAQGSKAPVQQLVDKIASVFVPTIIVIAIITFISWWFFGGKNGLEHALLSAVTVLIIACPCALGLATPTAIMVGIGKGAENGILIKDAESLELSTKINTIVLDKTGTITEGAPKVNDVIWLENTDVLRSILVSLERLSEHPLAHAVVSHFKDVQSVELESFVNIVGQGVQANYNKKTYYIGSPKLLRENNISVDPKLQKKADDWNKKAHTVVWFTDEHQALAALAISDKIKETSIDAIKRLKEMGMEMHILTGDNQATAQSVAQQTGISFFKAEVNPQEKAEYITSLQKDGKIVAMIGDGINDSTALATADVSIAMGKGSDIAMDVAKMTIISSDLNKIPKAIRLSSQTAQTIKENLFWAFIYNLIGVPIAAGVLYYPLNGFLLDPMIAGAAMAFSSVSVVSNSLRLKYKKL